MRRVPRERPSDLVAVEPRQPFELLGPASGRGEAHPVRADEGAGGCHGVLRAAFRRSVPAPECLSRRLARRQRRVEAKRLPRVAMAHRSSAGDGNIDAALSSSSSMIAISSGMPLGSSTAPPRLGPAVQRLLLGAGRPSCGPRPRPRQQHQPASCFRTYCRHASFLGKRGSFWHGCPEVSDMLEGRNRTVRMLEVPLGGMQRLLAYRPERVSDVRECRKEGG